MLFNRKRKKPAKKGKNKRIEGTRENLQKIKFATSKMLGFAFKVSPFHTTFVILSLFVISSVPFLVSWLNSRVIDELVIFTNGGVGSITKFYYLVLYYFLAILVRRTFSVFRRLSFQNMWFTISREMTSAVTSKLASLDTEYFDDPETRLLIQKVKSNYNVQPQQFVERMINSLRPLIQIILSFSILFFYSPLIVLILILVSIPEVLMNLVIGKRSWGIWDLKGETRRNYYWTNAALTNETSLRELRIANLKEYFLNKVYGLFYSFQKEQIKLENKRVKATVLTNLLSLVGFVYSFLKIGLSVISNAITLGQFSFFITTTSRLQSAIEEIFSNMSRVYEKGLYVYDIFKFLELESKIVPGHVKLEPSTKPPFIEFKNVSFKYPGTEKYVMKNFSLKINPGENIAIVGENGAGKTTLIKILMRFYDVNSGSIFINGTDLSELDIKTWYKYVGVLFQEFNFYHFDAKTNIAVGNIENIRDLVGVKRASKKAGSHKFIMAYKNRYDQILNKSFKNGITPSTGQKQRIALARVFFKDPPVLILDEPTSAIDPKAEYEIFEKLFEFAEKKTVIIISHRFSTVKNAERIIVLDKGKIIEDGAHEDLMKIEEGKYKVAFELQKKGFE